MKQIFYCDTTSWINKYFQKAYILFEQTLERDIKRFYVYIALYKWYKFCRVFNEKISEISDPNISFYKNFIKLQIYPKIN